MSDEPRLRGDALWKAQRDAISDRNDAARRRAQEEKRTRAATAAQRERRSETLEAQSLRDLNDKVAKGRLS